MIIHLISTVEQENSFVSSAIEIVQYYSLHLTIGINYLNTTLMYMPLNISEEPEEGIDERCYRANGFFNHEKEDECNKSVY